MWSVQLENVGPVTLQFSWQIVMDNFVDVKTAVMSNFQPTETPRPATAGPLMIRLDDTSNIRPSSALSDSNTARLLPL